MTTWVPLDDNLKHETGFKARCRDGEGNEFVAWNSGGDWLMDVTDYTEPEPVYEEEVCFPVEYDLTSYI